MEQQILSDPRNLRNVVLVGHSGAGKTTLAEALLLAAGVIDRAGSVPDGSTVGDSDPAEHKQQRSISLSLLPLTHDAITVNLLDTPGYPDFVGELRAGLRAADAALFVVSAVDGIDARTIALWEECAHVGMPRAVVVTKLDQPRADFDESVAVCQRVFGDGVLPLYLPVHDDAANGTVAGVIGLLSQQLYDYSDGSSPEVRPADPEHVSLIENARNDLIEGIIAESEDETLMDRYLGGEQVEVGVLVDDLETAVARGSFYPVLGAAALTGVGTAEILELLTSAFPSPLEHDPPAVSRTNGSPADPLPADPDGPLLAEVVKTTADPFVGRVSLLRVFSGTLRPDTTVHVCGHGMAERGRADHDEEQRLTHVYSARGTTLTPRSACVAGDLCAVTRLSTAETGDTVSTVERPLLVAPWELPEPLLPVAVAAASRSDEDALAKALARLVAGDPSVRLERNEDTHQLVLWSMGEAHAEVILDRLREGGVDVVVEDVRVPLRETLSASGSGHGRHVKQSGGHGQFAVCDVTVEPLPVGSGYEFVDATVGGSVPRQFVPSVDKGAHAQLAKGVRSGWPTVDCRVTLTDGKAHSVDSSDAAFQVAAGLAVREAAAVAGTTLLEPVDEVAVTVPDGYVGAVMSDLTSRRGRVAGSEPAERDRTTINAVVPQHELLRYLIDLRSLTAGTGEFTRTPAGFEPVPDHIAPTLLGEHTA